MPDTTVINKSRNEKMQYSRIIYVLFIAAILIVTSVFGQEFQLTKTAQIDPHEIFSVCLACDTLLFTGGDDIGIWDISDEANPELLSIAVVQECQYNDYDSIKKIVRRGDFLYFILDVNEGWTPDSLGIVDISDIYNPFFVQKVGVEGNEPAIKDIEVSDTLLYVAYGCGSGSKLGVYDISDVIPEQLYLDSRDNLWGEVEVCGEYVYYHHVGTLIDFIWNGTELEYLGEYIGFDNLPGIKYYTGYLYYKSNAELNNFKIIDIANPQAPYLWGILTLPSFGYLYDIENGSMVIGDNYVYDISNPTSPVFATELEYFDTYSYSKGDIGGDYYYRLTTTTSTTYHWMEIYDFSQLPNSELLYKECFSECENVEVLDDDYLLAGFRRKLSVFSITESGNLQPISELLSDKFISYTALYEDKAYVLLSDSISSLWDKYFQIIDFSDPVNPVLLDTTVVPQVISSEDMIIVNDSTIYCFDDVWKIIDINDDGTMTLIDSLTTHYDNFQHGAHFDSLTFVWGRRYSGSSFTSDLYIFCDVSGRDPQLLSTLSNLTFTQVYDVEKIGDYLVVGSNYDSLSIYDISTPQNPLPVCRFHVVNGTYKLCYKDGVLYQGSSSYLYAYDASDLPDLVVLDSLFAGYRSTDIEVKNNIVYYPTEGSGLWVIDNGLSSSYISPETKKVENMVDLYNVSAYPNPFNNSTTISFTLPEVGEISLKIYDISGREVQSLVTGHSSLGTHSVVWDAKDNASGIYFVRLEADGFVMTQKMVLMK